MNLSLDTLETIEINIIDEYFNSNDLKLFFSKLKSLKSCCLISSYENF